MAEKDFSSKIRGAIWKSRNNTPWWPIVYSNTTTCPQCKTNIYPQPDRPDIVCLRRGVECKIAAMSFSFDSISDGQREWANQRTTEGFSYWLALEMGEEKPNSKSENRKRAWLIPWSIWLDIEQIIIDKVGTKTLNLIAGKGSRKVAQEEHLDAINLLSDYELVWKESTWNIPDNHPWNQSDFVMFIKQNDKVIIERTDDGWKVSGDKLNITVTAKELVEIMAFDYRMLP